jgi:hypothetical protein
MFLDEYFSVEFFNQSKFLDLFSIMSIKAFLIFATFICCELTFDNNVLQIDFVHRIRKLEIKITNLD